MVSAEIITVCEDACADRFTSQDVFTICVFFMVLLILCFIINWKLVKKLGKYRKYAERDKKEKKTKVKEWLFE